MERYLDSFEINQTMEDGTFLLDASGSTIIQVLYFVGQNIPVLAYTGEGTSMYLTGYDQTHVRVYHPESGQQKCCPWRRRTRCLGQRGMISYAACQPYRFRSLRKTLHFSQICYNHNENELGRMQDSYVLF